MIGSVLWDRQSLNPKPNVESPSAVINGTSNTSPSNNSREGNFRLMSKTGKLGLTLMALAGALALVIVLGLNSSSDNGLGTQAASTSSGADRSPTIDSYDHNTDKADNVLMRKDTTKSEPNAPKSNKSLNYTSSGSLEAQVPIASSSIVDGYVTCSDMESDITEALKLFMNNFINNEAVSGEMYADCDPDNENWYDHLYGYDDYSYDEANGKTRSSIPSLEKETRYLTPDAHGNTDNENKHRSKNGGKAQEGFGQNSQTKGVNEQDKVVSDGTYVYAAYGDVLYAWPAADTMQGVSITHIPGNATECDENTTDPCTSISKPRIQALYLGNSRLTVIVEQYLLEYNTPKNPTQPIITDFDYKVDLRVYNISDVTLGYPLEEVGHKELTGFYCDGRSVGDKTFIVTAFYVNTSVITNALLRSQSQYCGLDTANYKELASRTAEHQVQSFAKQMIDELQLVNDCSSIFRISTMQSSTDEPGANMPFTGIDIKFVQVSALNMLDIGTPLKVAGGFIAYDQYVMYLADDFLAIPSNVFKFDRSSSSETFILGFDLSSEAGAIPYCYGHVPNGLSSNYNMDKFDNHLRIATYKPMPGCMDELIWNHNPKIFVLEIPSIQEGRGKMSVVGESESLADFMYIDGSRFDKDKVYVSTANIQSSEQNNRFEFFVVDLSDHLHPHAISSLKIDGHLSYMKKINIKRVPYILGVGCDPTWDVPFGLFLIDVSNSFSPKVTASYKVAEFSDVYWDFNAIRYLSKSKKIIIPFWDGTFGVYSIARNSITGAFNVSHSSPSDCEYEAALPARSFFIQSELITIQGHTAIRTDMQSGTFISELDLDVGLTYSICD